MDIVLPRNPTPWIAIIEQEGGVAIRHCIPESVRHELLAELETFTFSEQPERFGAYNVFQRFSAIETFDATSACARFAAHTAHTLND